MVLPPATSRVTLRVVLSVLEPLAMVSEWMGAAKMGPWPQRAPGLTFTLVASSLRFLCPYDCIWRAAVDFFPIDDDMAAPTPTIVISIRFWVVGLRVGGGRVEGDGRAQLATVVTLSWTCVSRNFPDWSRFSLFWIPTDPDVSRHSSLLHRSVSGVCQN